MLKAHSGLKIDEDLHVFNVNIKLKDKTYQWIHTYKTGDINKESIAKGVSFLPNGSLLEKYLISINKAKCSDNNINPTNTPSDNNSNKSNNNNNNNSNKSNNNNNTNQPKNICELKHPAIQVIDNMFENDHIISKNQAYNIYRTYETICNTVKQISTCENSSNIKLKVTNNTTLKKEDYNHLYHNLFVKEYLNNTEKNPYYILEKNRKYIDMEVVPKKEGGTRRHRKKLNKKTKKRKTNKRRKTRKIKNV